MELTNPELDTDITQIDNNEFNKIDTKSTPPMVGLVLFNVIGVANINCIAIAFKSIPFIML